jgi:signal transduction histidine kinase
VILLGVVAYVGLGQVVDSIPNPMVPNAILAFNMVVPVVVGYFDGPLSGTLVGLLGTTLNFLVKLPISGADLYEVVAILPHTLMGAAAGFLARSRSRINTALTIIIGHTLNICGFLLSGLLDLSRIWDTVFWTGLIAETMINLILIMFAISAIRRIQERHWLPKREGIDRRGILLASIGVVGLGILLTIGFLSGIRFAAYLFIIPVVLAAVGLSVLEAWVTAFLLSLVLGYAVLTKGLHTASQEVALILLLNLVALVVGELADNVREQRRLAQQRLAELRRVYIELEEADRMKDEMIQNISHELRTPLSILRGYADLLAQESLGKLSPDQQKAAQETLRCSYHLAHLVEQVTVLHRVERGDLILRPLNIMPLIRDRAERFQEKALQKRCSFSVSIEDEIPPLEGQAEYLGEAVDALLDNAVKFSPGGGQIEVRVWTDSERVYVSVQDQGIGISLDQQDHLFHRFFQANGSIRRRFGGMGIGLALVREVTQAHHGDVWVESRPGEGSLFGFWLPLSR